MKLPFFLAKRFVAAETFVETIPKIEEINKKGIRVTLDLLGENVSDRATADQTTRTYIQLLQQIREAGLKSTISIKLTMIGLDIEESYCVDNLCSILEEAKSSDSFVRIDMEGSAYTDQTIRIFKDVFQKYGEAVGIVIQAYLHRTADDIQELAELGADVRLCKGAYKEPADIALQKMPDIQEAFMRYAEVLLAKTPYPRFATHDDELIFGIQEYAARHKIPKERFEFQMLYGIRQETMEELSQNGYYTRIYVPYGTMWFPYYRRRLMERRENVSFVLKNLFRR